MVTTRASPRRSSPARRSTARNQRPATPPARRTRAAGAKRTTRPKRSSVSPKRYSPTIPTPKRRSAPPRSPTRRSARLSDVDGASAPSSLPSTPSAVKRVTRSAATPSPRRSARKSTAAAAAASNDIKSSTFKTDRFKHKAKDGLWYVEYQDMARANRVSNDAFLKSKGLLKSPPRSKAKPRVKRQIVIGEVRRSGRKKKDVGRYGEMLDTSQIRRRRGRPSLASLQNQYYDDSDDADDDNSDYHATWQRNARQNAHNQQQRGIRRSSRRTIHANKNYNEADDDDHDDDQDELVEFYSGKLPNWITEMEEWCSNNNTSSTGKVTRKSVKDKMTSIKRLLLSSMAPPTITSNFDSELRTSTDDDVMALNELKSYQQYWVKQNYSSLVQDLVVVMDGDEVMTPAGAADDEAEAPAAADDEVTKAIARALTQCVEEDDGEGDGDDEVAEEDGNRNGKGKGRDEVAEKDDDDIDAIVLSVLKPSQPMKRKNKKKSN